MPDPKLQVIPLGGLGDFGMNSMAIRYGDDIIIVDAGMMFPEAELLGVDIVTPDFAYLEENREHVRALILTHGHEDHIGAVPFLLSQMNIPVYGTAFTLALVERRLDEHSKLKNYKLNEIHPRKVFEVGPFKIEPIHVTHSIVSAVAFAITTPAGVIIHTGDFKIDSSPTDNLPFDFHTFAEYGRKGVLLLLSDSTNVYRPGFTESERAVRPRLEQIFQSAERRVVVCCFSSSIHRLQTVLELAHEHGRKVAVLGRSMNDVTEIAHDLGFLRIPDSLLLRPQDIMSTNASKVCVLVSGTQGEPMSAMSRVAVDNHKHLSLEPGDTVVLSARIIPGNEKGIYRMINHVTRRGAEVIYGQMTPPVHVSGHASAEELKILFNLVQPKYFVPLHGEYRQLKKHAALADSLRHARYEKSIVLETGESLEIDSTGAHKGPKITVGRVCIDSGSLDEVVEDIVIRDRRHLSEDGFVLPIVVIDKNTGKLEGQPEIVSRGFVSLDEPAAIEEAKQIVIRTIESSNAEERTDWGVMQEKVRVDLKRFLTKKTSRRPLIVPVILEV